MNVVLIMLDGLRPDAISRDLTPALMDFMEYGSYTLTAQSVNPSITLPCHTSIFHSVPPSRHGIMDNNWHAMARPVTNLVGHLRGYDKLSGFYHNWDFLRDLTRPGELYFSFFMDRGYDLDGDEVIVKQAGPSLQAEQFDFTFVYFASIDVAGHTFGWMTDEYLNQVRVVDQLVKRLLSVVPQSSTVIIQADHGGHERTHGTTMPEDMTIPWVISGPNIKQNHVIQRSVSLLDTAPTITKLLGVPPHQQWEGQAVDEVFIN